MSKQSEAKERQGYLTKVVPMTCKNCRNYESIFTTRKSFYGAVYHDESARLCGLGGFAVNKTGWCKEHQLKG